MAPVTPRWSPAPPALAASATRVAPGVLRLDAPTSHPARSTVAAGQEPAAAARAALAEAGYAVAELDGAGVTDVPGALRALATALRLPEVTNLDALVDSLRDLATWWPDAPAVALVWRHSDVLQDADADGFAELVDILSGAHEELWQAPRTPGATGGAEDRVLRVVLAPDATGHDTTGHDTAAAPATDAPEAVR